MSNEGRDAWLVRGRTIALDRPLIFGILNATPDSFSDGGRFVRAADAVAHAERMVSEGADAIDVGGESTRPQGATPVSVDEERRRVIPLLRELRQRFPDTILSVDTVKSEVADAALAEGADVVNDVSGFRLDPQMGEICAREGAGVIVMHSRGGVSEMATYAFAHYGADLVGEVASELRTRVEIATAAGVAAGAIVVDPGIGFGKRGEHSLAVLAGVGRIVAAVGRPVMVGVSRKRFIGELTGVGESAERVHGTTGANVAALMRGARLFRVHDVRPARQALDVAWAVLRAGTNADAEVSA